MIATSVLLIYMTATDPLTYIESIDIRQYKLQYFMSKTKNIDVIFCHKKIKKPLIAALNCVQFEETKWGTKMLFNFAGCYVNRKIHGTNRWSNHKWGTAIDLNVTAPASKLQNNQHPRLVKCFKAQGFKWGGDWKNKDYMHFEYPIDI